MAMKRRPPVLPAAERQAGTPPLRADDWIDIGVIAHRSGLAASALRFYESEGLITGSRGPSGRRRYPRSVLRRLAFIRVAQSIGLTLDEIQAAFASLPGGRTPTVADWERLSTAWRPLLDQRIEALTRLRDRLTSCIGCGCLSIQRCALYNPGDTAASRGAGPRWLMGDPPPKPQDP
jgi:MerR family redox-sensitive transcriptional activator SoxR